MCVWYFYKSFNYWIGKKPLYCVSLPGYTWQCGLKHTGKKLKTLPHKHTISLLGINICGGINSVREDRCLISDENKKIFYIDATYLYGHSMSQPLPYDEVKFQRSI